MLFNFQGTKDKQKLIRRNLETSMAIANEIFHPNNGLENKVSVINAEGPPVPIPNTEVKLCSGENTLRETVREDSSMLTSVMGTDKTVPKPLPA